MIIMLKFLLLFIISLASLQSLAQTFNWVSGVETLNSVDGYSLAVDAEGNSYTAGSLVGTGDFDPGGGILNLTSNGSNDIFISKLDSSGNLVWALNIGGSNSDLAYSIDLDPLNNIYITGRFSGTSDFDPGTGVYNLTSAGNADVFVCKLNSSGSFIWAVSMGGVSGDIANSLAVDDQGNILVTGVFSQTADFDPGPGTYNLTTSILADIFVTKLDSSGNFLWAVSTGGTSSDSPSSIAIDQNDNVYVTGVFLGTADMDPGPGIYNLTSIGSSDVFVWKLSSTGAFVWAVQFEGISLNQSYGMAINSIGEIVTTGFIQGVTDFDPGPAVYNLVPTTGSELFISKIDSFGNFVWAKNLPINPGYGDRSVNHDAMDNIYLTGNFMGSADFDPGPGTFNLVSNGDRDVFICKLDPDGNFNWAGQMGGPDFDIGYNVGFDGSGNLYAHGIFNGTSDFDPGTGVYNLTSLGSADDHFNVRLDQCMTVTGIDTQVACDSFLWIDGNVYTSSNNSATFNLYGGSVNGCDSLVTLNLTITYIDTSITQSGVTLTANSTSSIYQWVDCNDGYSEIFEETNQSFTPVANGEYAVIISDFGCTDTSACNNVISVGVQESDFDSSISIYPSPTSGTIRIDLGQLYQEFKVTVYNALGQELKTVIVNSTSSFNIDIPGGKGVGFIKCSTVNNSAVFRIIKN